MPRNGSLTARAVYSQSDSRFDLLVSSRKSRCPVFWVA
jgi:hypothetical protein